MYSYGEAKDEGEHRNIIWERKSGEELEAEAKRWREAAMNGYGDGEIND